jgi:hypothetical protein
MSRIYTPVSAAPVKVYNPGGQGTPHAVLYNSGTSTVYIGGINVSPATGFPMGPSTQITIANAQYSLYAAASGVVSSGSNTAAALIAGGATSVSASATTGFVVGSQIIIGTTSTEVVTLTIVSSSKTVTWTPACGFYHPSGAPMKLVTGAAGSTVYAEQTAT